MSGTAGSVLDPHNSMRARDISKVTKGEQAPRPTKHASQTDFKNPKQRGDDDHEEVVVVEAPPDSRNCYAHYIEYQRCRKARGKEAPECQKLVKHYLASCPAELVDRWDAQVENGTFPARI